MPTVRNSRLMLVVLALLLGTGASSRAGYSSETGAVQVIAAPPSVQPGALMSNTFVQTFVEHQSLTLTSSVHVDDTAAGTFTSPASLVGGSIASGSQVDSYFFHSDPTAKAETYTGSVTFTSDIIGVIVLSHSLNLTDAQLGAVGTSYPTGVSNRGLELGTTSDKDSFTLSADLKTLTFSLHTSSAIDEIRVLTEPTAVPEPASALLLGLAIPGVLGLARLRRNRNAS
jgi:hypothetical protein